MDGSAVVLQVRSASTPEHFSSSSAWSARSRVVCHHSYFNQSYQLHRWSCAGIISCVRVLAYGYAQKYDLETKESQDISSSNLTLVQLDARVSGDLGSRRCEKFWFAGFRVRHQCIHVPLARAWQWIVLSGWSTFTLAIICISVAFWYIQCRAFR